MIIKMLSRHNPSYGSLIKYILQEGKGINGEKPEPLLHNVKKGKDLNDFVQQFYQNEAFRKIPRKGQTYFQHAIISFSDKDAQNITPEILNDIAKKFIELRGKNGMYIGGIHSDKNHSHIHLMISSCEFRTGRGFRMAKSELYQLKQELQTYHKEKYPELIHSLPEHGAGREYINSKEYGYRNRTNKKTIREEITEKVKLYLSQSKSQTQFLSLLRENGLHHYERGTNGIPTGVTFNDTHYRFSRLLGEELNHFKNLPIDRTESEIALAEIQKLREQITANREMDTPDFYES